MMKKLTALLLAFLMLMTVSSLGEEQPVLYAMAGYESSTGRDWNTNAFFSRMQEKTGIGFTFSQYSDATQWHSYVEGLTVESTLPHVLFKADLYGYETIELYRKGVLIDLTPYLQNCCPALWALLESYPDVKDAITITVDRQDVIIALPYINETPLNCGIWVNKKWLQRAGLNIDDITTPEAFEDMLTRFHEIYPGDIPLAFIGSFDLKFLAHMWGLYGNNYNMYVDEAGTAGFMPEDERFYDFVSTMRRWYAGGLLDHDGYIKTDSIRQITSASDNNPYGAVITTAVTNFLPSEWSRNYVLLTPIACDGKVTYRDYFGHAITGTFALTSRCTEDDITALLNWVDLLYSSNGAALASAGEKGAEYVIVPDADMTVEEMIADGTHQWQLINTSTASTVQIEQLITGGTTAPGYSADAFQRLYNEAGIKEMFEQQEKLRTTATRPFPYYTLDREQLQYISRLQNGEGSADGIGYWVDEQMALWILGEEELTPDSYSAFIARLYEMGLQEFKDFWQGIADNTAE